MADGIDFIIVGAQKAGTTSLFRHLAAHPAVFMPPEKETEFFYRPELFARGQRWYLDRYFEDARADQVRGEASPQYMCDRAVPGRIRSCFPGAKIIMILRNPIDRAYSHFRMNVRRGRFRDDLRAAIHGSLAQLDAPFGLETADLDLIRFGRYGEILSWFQEYFPKDQIKVMFLENLEADPTLLIRDLYKFIGVDAAFQSPTATRKYHVGGEKRWPRIERFIRRQGWLKSAVRRALGERHYARLYFWFEVEGGVRPLANGPLGDTELRSWLCDLFREDVARLENLTGMAVPWADFRAPRA